MREDARFGEKARLYDSNDDDGGQRANIFTFIEKIYQMSVKQSGSVIGGTVYREIFICAQFFGLTVVLARQ